MLSAGVLNSIFFGAYGLGMSVIKKAKSVDSPNYQVTWGFQPMEKFFISKVWTCHYYSVLCILSPSLAYLRWHVFCWLHCRNSSDLDCLSGRPGQNQTSDSDSRSCCSDPWSWKCTPLQVLTTNKSQILHKSFDATLYLPGFFRGPFDVVRKLIQQEGIRGCYRGLSAMAAR